MLEPSNQNLIINIYSTLYKMETKSMEIKTFEKTIKKIFKDDHFFIKNLSFLKKILIKDIISSNEKTTIKLQNFRS